MSWRYLVGLILVLTAIAAATEEAGVSIRDAWVREAPPGATMMAGYMVLKNNTPRSQVLVAARSSGFGTVMIHRTVVKGGLTGMEHASKIELLPNASLLFEPGGYHLMLLNPNRALHAGDRVDINLEFLGGLVIPVTYEVRK
jgi:copper(I)-binding protein